MTEHDHEQLTDELAAETDKLARENERVKKEIGETRSDWERKRRDPAVPGANPPGDD